MMHYYSFSERVVLQFFFCDNKFIKSRLPKDDVAQLVRSELIVLFTP